jgi:hypothetical protein
MLRKYGTVGVWEYGNMGIWDYGIMGLWGRKKGPIPYSHNPIIP